ncbi:hypothetical protein PTI45_04025 [Paenibacillus nuruki]|uniref:Uncharacterized protein n=1 Tax=Paenibacillus nuruki TaxID=1886670 RepID=A0A1E3L0X8_9BACL|nr:hypothetical protein [Paenibacillus nuruki]ODP26620.1 hypothetical protein PTI45_04025 [Paenibacillus nuruki]
MEHTTSINKPLILGNYYYGGGEMAWAWYHEHHADLAIIGHHELSPRHQIVQQLQQAITKRDDKAVYSITVGKPQPGEKSTINAIDWLEGFSDPPEFIADRDLFIKNRIFFSSSYYNLILKSINADRETLLPSVRYKANLEGPLAGYMRAIDAINDDNIHKAKLISATKNILEVDWIHTNNEGHKYFIDPDASIYEQTISLLIATWSLFSLTCQEDDPQQYLVIAEIPKQLLSIDVDPMVGKIVYDCISLLKQLSITTTLTLVLSTEMLFPVPELAFRYKLLFQTKDSDYDLTHNQSNRESIDPNLIKDWDEYQKFSGLWIDDITSNTEDGVIALKMNPNTFEFWDSFEDKRID